MRKPYNRRSFLKNSAAGTAIVAGYTATRPMKPSTSAASEPGVGASD